METYLNEGIKEVIDQFPEVENILNEYEIGCAPCTVGTCLLKDIVEIHNLPADKEQEMMTRIAKTIYPDREVEIPQMKRKIEAEPEEMKYSPPMKKLVDEHVLIKRLVALLPEIVKNLDVDSDEGRQLVIDTVEFIRFYADKYHHAKEEDIFGYSAGDARRSQTGEEPCESHTRGTRQQRQGSDCQTPCRI
jgi:hypothetical protein